MRRRPVRTVGWSSVPSTPPPLPCVIPDSPAEMRHRIGKATAVVRGTVVSSQVIGLAPPHARQRETEFRFNVAEVMVGGLQGGTEVLIAAIGSVELLRPVGVEHVVFLLLPNRPREGRERYAVLGGPLGRFALWGDVCRLECFRRGRVVEVAEMPRARFEVVLSAATRNEDPQGRP